MSLLNSLSSSPLLQYLGLFAASGLFEFAYVAWARSCSQFSPGRTTAWSVLVAGLGLLGVGGALTLPHGYIPYLTGIALGSWLASVRKHTNAS